MIFYPVDANIWMTVFMLPQRLNTYNFLVSVENWLVYSYAVVASSDREKWNIKQGWYFCKNCDSTV